jgi:hypothetical protein
MGISPSPLRCGLVKLDIGNFCKLGIPLLRQKI